MAPAAGGWTGVTFGSLIQGHSHAFSLIVITVLYHWPGGLFSSDSVSFPSLDKEARIAICRGWEATGCSGKVVVSESEGLGVSPRPQRWPRRSVSVSEERQPS